jgi:hypothetical protein
MPLLAERGITVSYETVRRWVNHFGSAIATDLRKRRPKPHSTWHLVRPAIPVLARTESSELRPCRRGARSPPRLEPSGVDGFAASAIPQRDNAEKTDAKIVSGKTDNIIIPTKNGAGLRADLGFRRCRGHKTACRVR